MNKERNHVSQTYHFCNREFVYFTTLYDFAYANPFQKEIW